jgi:hypothetical protein
MPVCPRDGRSLAQMESSGPVAWKCGHCDGVFLENLALPAVALPAEPQDEVPA